MDGANFDLLSRTFAAAISRRGSLSRLAGGLLVALGLTLEEMTVFAKKNKKGKGKKKKCPKDRPKCGSKCCQADETCQKGKCVHHCQDGVKNLGETGIDCGGTCVENGSSFGTCAVGQGCEDDDDCFTDVCVSKGAGKECVFCRDSSDCPRTSSNGPACIDNECFECSRDADCPRPGQPENRRHCVAPLAGGCPNDQPCACRECKIDADCPSGQLCDENNACIGNTCGEDQDFCLDGILGCNGNPNCHCRQTTSDTPICAHADVVVCGCPGIPCPSDRVCVKNPGGNCDNAGGACQTVCVLPC